MKTVQLNSLVQAGIVEDYPPLVDKKGSYSAQFEHVSTIRILQGCTEAHN